MFAGEKGEKFTKDFVKSDFLKYQNLSISEHLVQLLKKKNSEFFCQKYFFKNIFLKIFFYKHFWNKYSSQKYFHQKYVWKKYFAKYISKKDGGKAPLLPAGPRLISSDSEISA